MAGCEKNSAQENTAGLDGNNIGRLEHGLHSAIFGRSRWSSAVRRIAAVHYRRYARPGEALGGFRWTAHDYLILLVNVAEAKMKRPAMETHEDFERYLAGMFYFHSNGNSGRS